MLPFLNNDSKSSLQTECQSRSQIRERVEKEDLESKDLLESMGKYSLLKRISLNGINSVWTALVKEDKKKIVVKVARKRQLTDNQKFHLQKHKEALTILKSQHFVQMIQVIETQYFDYFVMQYVQNGDLSNHLLVGANYIKTQQKQKLFKKAQKVIFQVCLALKEIHDCGYVYQDLKPENILFDGKGKIKITDFGLVIKQGCVDKSLCGTPSYMAPQRLQYTKLSNKIEKSIDMWSLGVMIYEMLNGELPYLSDSPGQLIQQIFSIRPSFDKKFNKEGKNLICRLMEINPRKRLSINEVLEHEFFNEIRGEMKIKDIKAINCEQNVMHDFKVQK